MPSPRRRVLVLNERDPLHPQAGGAEIHVAEIFGRLARRGHAVTLACSSFEGAADLERVDDLRVRRLGPLWRYYPSVLATTRRETRRGDFDLVVECLNKVPFFSPLYAQAPVLALCHHLFGEAAFSQVAWPIAAGVWTLERGIPSLYRGVPFVAISESSARDLVQRGIEEPLVRVSHCGIERSLQQVDTSTPRGRRVAYVGRIEAYKRVDVFLRAMAGLSPEFDDVEILVIGRGSERAALETLAHELGLAKRTRFTGFVSNEERDRLLAETRVCVCPSEKEGWGLTVIESNSAGTPVVASDAPGLRDSVRNGETGFLAPVGNASAFAARIAELLRDDALATRMSKAALAWSHEFDWDQSADEMEEEIERAIERGAR